MGKLVHHAFVSITSLKNLFGGGFANTYFSQYRFSLSDEVMLLPDIRTLEENLVSSSVFWIIPL